MESAGFGHSSLINCGNHAGGNWDECCTAHQSHNNTHHAGAENSKRYGLLRRSSAIPPDTPGSGLAICSSSPAVSVSVWRQLGDKPAERWFRNKPGGVLWVFQEVSQIGLWFRPGLSVFLCQYQTRPETERESPVVEDRSLRWCFLPSKVSPPWSPIFLLGHAGVLWCWICFTSVTNVSCCGM